MPFLSCDGVCAVAVILFIISLTFALFYQRLVLRRDTQAPPPGRRDGRHLLGPGAVRAAAHRGSTTSPILGRHAADLPVAILVAGFAIGPLIYVVIGGFRTTGQLALQPLGLPNPWVTSNYTDVLLSGTFWRQVFNSVLIAVIATVLVVGCGSLAAFAVPL